MPIIAATQSILTFDRESGNGTDADDDDVLLEMPEDYHNKAVLQNMPIAVVSTYLNILMEKTATQFLKTKKPLHCTISKINKDLYEYYYIDW